MGSHGGEAPPPLAPAIHVRHANTDSFACVCTRRPTPPRPFCVREPAYPKTPLRRCTRCKQRPERSPGLPRQDPQAWRLLPPLPALAGLCVPQGSQRGQPAQTLPAAMRGPLGGWALAAQQRPSAVFHVLPRPASPGRPSAAWSWRRRAPPVGTTQTSVPVWIVPGSSLSCRPTTTRPTAATVMMCCGRTHVPCTRTPAQGYLLQALRCGA